MGKTSRWLQATLNRPFKVFIYGLIFLFANLVLNGSLYRLYDLHKNMQSVQAKIEEEAQKMKKMQTLLKAAQDPSFMARQARDQLELLEKDDLLFVFTDEHP